MKAGSYPFRQHKDKKVKITGTFLYSPDHCIILNLETKKEFMLEDNKDFIEALDRDEIENIVFNDETIYISEVCTLYGSVKKLRYSYILTLDNFRKFVE